MSQSSRPRPWRTSQPEISVSRGLPQRFFRDERFSTLIASMVVGVCGGMAALGFRFLIDGSWWLFLQVGSLGTFAKVALMLGLPATGGLLVGWLSLGRKDTPGAHGMAEIRAAFITSGGVLHPRTALLHAVSCAITTGSGASAGCEGPVARVAGAVGSWLAQRLGLDKSRMQILVACGVSASLAGLLQTPIAAVVFATEVILGGYAIRSLAPLVISAGTATAIVRWIAGTDVPFQLPTFLLVGPLDLLIHLLVGLGCGVMAAGFIHMLDWCQGLRIPLPAMIQPALGGLLVGGIALVAPRVLGVGYPALSDLFLDDTTVLLLGLLLVGKLVATIVTLGSRGVGGVFAPSLMIGAALGWLMGLGTNKLFPSTFAPPTTFAVVGMAAMIAGVTHAPFTGAILVVELTRSYHAVLPGVVAAVAASILSTSIRDDSVYGLALTKKGLHEPLERHTTALTIASLQDMLDPVRDTVPSTLSAREFLRRLPMARSTVLVVAEEGRVLGVISTRKAVKYDQEALSDQPVTHMMTDTGTLRLEDSVARALVQFMRHDAPAMPVVDAAGLLLGLVWRSDLMDFCAHDLLRDHLHLGGAVLPSVWETDARPLRHDVAAMPVPRVMVGRSLREVDLGKQFGLVCIGLRRANESGAFVAVQPSPSLVLRVDDVLILTGNALDLQRLSQLEDDGPPSLDKKS